MKKRMNKQLAEDFLAIYQAFDLYEKQFELESFYNRIVEFINNNTTIDDDRITIASAKTFHRIYNELKLGNHELCDMHHLARLFVIPDDRTWDISTGRVPYTETECVLFEGVRMSIEITDQQNIRLLTIMDEDKDRMLIMTIDIEDGTSHIDGIYPSAHFFRLYGIYKSIGAFILRLADSINVIFQVRSSSLVDASTKMMCGTTRVKLKELFLYAYGNSWYMSHGFLPTIHSHTFVQDLSDIRSMSMHGLYGSSAAIHILEHSGLYIKSSEYSMREYTMHMKIGHFFSLMCDQLLNNVQQTCNGINMILNQTADKIQRMGIDLFVGGFTKNYTTNRIQFTSRRVHRR
jgi:hypothetical protein